MLPGASFVEKEASYTNDQGRLQGTARAIPAAGRRDGRLADPGERWRSRSASRSTTRAPRRARRHRRAIRGASRACAGLPTLTFARAVTARHWLQASNPSERWKWDFMFQDLPPVKGSVEPSALPPPPGSFRLREVK